MPSTTWGVVDPLLQAIISPQVSHVETCDIELIRHYSVTDPATFATIPGLFPLRRINIAEKAPQYPFLLHGLLAVCALHLQATEADIPTSRRLFYTEKASHWQQVALSSYIPMLNSITDQTCHSIFAFSAMLSGLSFAFLCQREQSGSAGAGTLFENIVNIFDLLLGAVAVADRASKWIEQCRTEPLIIPIKATLARADDSVDIEAQNAIKRLVAGASAANVAEVGRASEFADIDISVIFDSAIPELRNVFRCLGMAGTDRFVGVIGWPAFVKSSYVTLLKQRHPAALVVLAYYGVALHALDHAWWLKGVGSKIVNAVATIVGTRYGQDWQTLLQWPLGRIAQPYHRTGSATTQDSPHSISFSTSSSGSSPAFEFAFRYTYSNDLAEPRATDTGDQSSLPLVDTGIASSAPVHGAT